MALYACLYAVQVTGIKMKNKVSLKYLPTESVLSFLSHNGGSFLQSRTKLQETLVGVLKIFHLLNFPIILL